jgi:TrmH RNA methyltransferase
MNEPRSPWGKRPPGAPPKRDRPVQERDAMERASPYRQGKPHRDEERAPRSRPPADRPAPERPAPERASPYRQHRAERPDARQYIEPGPGERMVPERTAHPRDREHRTAELRLYGLNAVRAMFARRPEALRKLYLAEHRIPQLQPLLKWCVANRIGYRVVDEEDLQKLAASAHHEGVVAEVLREEPAALTTWLQDLPAGPHVALWLAGVGNPHNLGAILRSAAHFGVTALLLPKHSTLALSGAAARVAEGGAEVVPFVRLGRDDNAIAQLRGAGFTLAATVVRGGAGLFDRALPDRLVYVLGAEGEGMDPELAKACDLQLSIPGSGQVESLNVAAATAVFLAEWARTHARGA